MHERTELGQIKGSQDYLMEVGKRVVPLRSPAEEISDLGNDFGRTLLAAETKKEVPRATQCLPSYSMEPTHSLASSAEWLGMEMEKSTGTARISRDTSL